MDAVENRRNRLDEIEHHIERLGRHLRTECDDIRENGLQSLDIFVDLIPFDEVDVENTVTPDLNLLTVVAGALPVRTP